MDLLLVRHALPERIDEAPDGRADPSLTDEGRDQARRLAAWLAGEPVDAVWSSPLRRARETAEPVAAAHGLPVQVEDGLAEWDGGSSFYVPIEELRAADDPRYRALAEGRWGEYWDIDPVRFRAGVVEAMERVIAAHPGDRVVVVCHGGVINAYLGHVLGIERMLFFLPAYAGISRVAASRDGVRSLVSLNEAAHLRLAPPAPAG